MPRSYTKKNTLLRLSLTNLPRRYPRCFPIPFPMPQCLWLVSQWGRCNIHSLSVVTLSSQVPRRFRPHTNRPVPLRNLHPSRCIAIGINRANANARMVRQTYYDMRVIHPCMEYTLTHQSPSHKFILALSMSEGSTALLSGSTDWIALGSATQYSI